MPITPPGPRSSRKREPDAPSGDLWIEFVARDVWIPVCERPKGIVLPRPYVKRVERRQPEAIGALEQVKQLTSELRGPPRVLRIPVGGQDQIVYAGDPHAS